MRIANIFDWSNGSANIWHHERTSSCTHTSKCGHQIAQNLSLHCSGLNRCRWKSTANNFSRRRGHLLSSCVDIMMNQLAMTWQPKWWQQKNAHINDLTKTFINKLTRTVLVQLNNWMMWERWPLSQSTGTEKYVLYIRWSTCRGCLITAHRKHSSSTFNDSRSSSHCSQWRMNLTQYNDILTAAKESVRVLLYRDMIRRWDRSHLLIINQDVSKRVLKHDTTAADGHSSIVTAIVPHCAIAQLLSDNNSLQLRSSILWVQSYILRSQTTLISLTDWPWCTGVRTSAIAQQLQQQ